MVAVLKLAVALLCLASVSAIETALLDTFAQVAVNAINKDERSGDKLYVIHDYDEIKETENGVTFDLIAVQTSCPKDTREKEKCKGNRDSSILYHKVSVTKKADYVYSVTNTGSMVPIEGDTLGALQEQKRK
ncbi:hypothetical protein M514_10968 [Trichuris suis]|uniref:Cystatin domain-containing protein n=1 Tax=Trichuris suis TaxID=68888 RepID=A0A085LT86_9BILA|nr:hypothetical protein M513_10968 [Trichuris suis]KFD61919.1 hypothetical protein M514_10968 [Trichuris suis]